MIGIYKITSPTGKIYIGQSSNINDRKCKYRSLRCKSQSKLYSSLLSHGFDNHSFQVLEECEFDDLIKREEYYINLFDTFNTKHGLNLRSGGGSKSRMHPEIVKRIADKKRGRKVVFSDEHKRRLSIAAKKRGMPRYVVESSIIAKTGKKDSEETKIKKSLAGKKRWLNGIGIPKYKTKGQIGKLWRTSRTIHQISLDGAFIKEWYGTYEISRALGFNHSNINVALSSKTHKSKGFLWIIVK